MMVQNTASYMISLSVVDGLQSHASAAKLIEVESCFAQPSLVMAQSVGEDLYVMKRYAYFLCIKMPPSRQISFLSCLNFECMIDY